MKTKEELKKEFDDYISGFDMDNPKISKKYYHTFRVAKIAEEIAQSINMSEEEIHIAYTVGLLHDVGRFIQVKKYDCFSDTKSLDHGDAGAEILSLGLINNFVDDDKYKNIIIQTVKYHNKFEVDEEAIEKFNFTEREKYFSKFQEMRIK